MRPRVTAIVVTHRGAAHLRRTLDAVRAQSRQPDAVIVLDMSSSSEVAAMVAEFAPTHSLSTSERVSFGSAVATAARVAPPPASDDEWLWFLAQDSAPVADALEQLVAAVEVSPSVAIAGPKLVDWDEESYIRELGESMTPLGAAVTLVEDELDQAQHDGKSDVLAVSSASMIIRHRVWESLDGFDPGLPVVDDGLDLSIRARLAGHRVIMVPAARVATAGDGIAGPAPRDRRGNRRNLYRARRSAQLHRRMVYAPGGALVFHWLSLVPLAVVRSLGWLLAKQPSAIGGELAAAFATAFGAGHIGEARSRLARTRTAKWSSLAPLRIPQSEARRARGIRREAALIRSRGERGELTFFSGGGVWVVLGALVVSLALFAPLLGGGTLAGGSLLPVSSEIGQVWANVGYGWRDIGLGFVGAADPFTAVVAVISSLTFWAPSFALYLLWFAAMPLAALGAWFCSTRLTHRAGLRALFAIAWAVAPMLLDALQTGRPAAVITHLLLPWLFFAGFAARRSWSASATTAIIAAAVAACSPSLIPALLVIWLISLCLGWRRIGHLIAIPVPAIALFAPIVWQQGSQGRWLELLADPGLPVLGMATHPLQLAIGFPDGELGGWHQLTGALGLPAIAPAIVVPILVAPLAILAILALFLRGTIRATLILVGAFLGFATAVLAVQVSVSVLGSQTTPIWPGAGLSLYWLGLIGAATMGLTALGRFAIAPAWVAAVTLMAAIAPLAAAMPLGQSAVSATKDSALPAFVTAESANRPRTGTLVLTPQPDGGLASQLVRGAGTTLDDQSTIASTRQTLTAGEQRLATLSGNLASTSGRDPSADLKALGIDFVLLAPSAPLVDGTTTGASATTRERTRIALEGDALLDEAGSTAAGQLWTVSGQSETAPPAALIPSDAGGIVRPLVYTGLGIVFGIALLLSIPTGRAERGELRRLSATELADRRRAAAERVVVLPDETVEPEPEPELEPGPEPGPEPEPESDREPEPQSVPEAEPEAEAVSEPVHEHSADVEEPGDSDPDPHEAETTEAAEAAPEDRAPAAEAPHGSHAESDAAPEPDAPSDSDEAAAEDDRRERPHAE